MQVITLTTNMEKYKIQAARLLEVEFPQAYSNCAENEIEECLSPDMVLLAAVDGDMLLGIVGGRPQYGETGWELHPLAVVEKYREKGIATRLCGELEDILRKKGCLTIYLGTDDEKFKTSLADPNLFENLFEKIKNIKNINRHPYEFYQKAGYSIVGAIPNAGGIGKPDIIMAKSLV
jgi:aminoglycoside 6'-N-acetyltransferase I